MIPRSIVLANGALVLLAAGCSGPSSVNATASESGSPTPLYADASVQPGDGASPADSPSRETDSADAGADADGGPFCSTPLVQDGGLTSLDNVPWSAWCEATQGQISEWTCGAITAVVIGNGGDCDWQYLFDSTSRALVAILEGCNGGHRCAAGNPDFQQSETCWGGDASIGNITEVCAEGGLADATPDGAGSSCTSSAQCPSGFVCGYFTNDPCTSIGNCVFADFAHDPTCSPTTLCACDGTVTQACVGFVGGYALKPVPTRGQMATCGAD